MRVFWIGNAYEEPVHEQDSHTNGNAFSVMAMSIQLYFTYREMRSWLGSMPYRFKTLCKDARSIPAILAALETLPKVDLMSCDKYL